MNEHGHRAVAGYCEEHKHAANKECCPVKFRMNEGSEDGEGGDKYAGDQKNDSINSPYLCFGAIK